jgi:hypothetical protein
VVGHAEDADFAHQVLQRVTREASFDEVMRLETAANVPPERPAPAKQLYRPADLDIFNSRFAGRHHPFRHASRQI